MLEYLLRQDGNEGWLTLTQHDGYVSYPSNSGGEDRAPCMWFALCDNDAATTRPHPILGDVPICTRCATKIDIV
jgi:hypothetical protein